MLVAVGLGRGGAVAGSLVLVLYLSGGIQLHVRNYIGAQLSGADVPCALVLIVVSALNFLDALAILSYLIQEGIFLSGDVQVAGAVSGRLSDPGDEVDVGLREQVSDLLVELGVVSQVQSALTSSVEGEPSILVAAEVDGNFLSIVLELYSAVSVGINGIAILDDIGTVIVVDTVGQRQTDANLVLSLLSAVLAGAQVESTGDVLLLGGEAFLGVDLYPVGEAGLILVSYGCLLYSVRCV